MEQKRLLIVDDNEEIHKDFLKILGEKKTDEEIDGLRAMIFGSDESNDIALNMPTFQIDSAYQGEQGLECIQAAKKNNQPYALAFVDVRMPPGWDGIYTIEQLWKMDPDLQVVICTAYSDYSFDDIYRRLNGSDNFLILKKPFDAIEILQLASTLTKKWELSKQAQKRIKKQHTQIEYHLKKSEFLFNLSQLSHTEFSTHGALQLFVNDICKLQHWPVGHIYRVKEQEAHPSVELISTDIWYVENNVIYQDMQKYLSQSSSEVALPLAKRILKNGVPCWLNDDGNQVLLNEDYFMHSIRDGFAVPIRLYDKTIAVAEFYSEQTMLKDPKFLDFITTAANQLGTLLERRQNEKKLKKNYEKVKKLYQELQATQAQLIQHSKLVAIGQLAAGVAHEINNPIAYVISNTKILQGYMSNIQEIISDINNQLLQIDSDSVDKLKEHWVTLLSEKNIPFLQEDIQVLLKECLEGLNRIKEIVGDLKTFSHTDEGELQKANVNQCIDVTLKIVWNELKYKCTVKKEYSDVPLIWCNPRQLNQVFMNLLVNAVQAIPEKGEIIIRTRHNNDLIEIEVQDTGTGIKQEHIEKLFDPFFTTKPVGTGTGLGLSISYNIIKKHQGRIEVKSKLNEGTTFTIYLPAIERKKDSEEDFSTEK
ncbi:ATP-binding protein [Legionella fallonii]|uniref:histidine kinase n=1 Tax=Legionella fallonii LLAP-10 TaxID=1212491 RepID=A0A098G655_9GAMM|nr:ATP-binding protein [Legionella fallonii]CEG57983.1 putative Histidine kinase [Legionella fallonii LLAP-10]